MKIELKTSLKQRRGPIFNTDDHIPLSDLFRQLKIIQLAASFNTLVPKLPRQNITPEDVSAEFLH